MKGFMMQQRASWDPKVYPGHDPLTGKKRYAMRTVRGGKREAQSGLAEMITKAERGLTVRTSATVGGCCRGLLSAWIEFVAPDFSSRTVKGTKGYINPTSPEALGRALRRAAVELPGLGCYLMLASATGARR